MCYMNSESLGWVGLISMQVVVYGGSDGMLGEHVFCIDLLRVSRNACEYHCCLVLIPLLSTLV